MKQHEIMELLQQVLYTWEFDHWGNLVSPTRMLRWKADGQRVQLQAKHRARWIPQHSAGIKSVRIEDGRMFLDQCPQCGLNHWINLNRLPGDRR